jgi:hypothetical protein
VLDAEAVLEAVNRVGVRIDVGIGVEFDMDVVADVDGAGGEEDEVEQRGEGRQEKDEIPPGQKVHACPPCRRAARVLACGSADGRRT